MIKVGNEGSKEEEGFSFGHDDVQVRLSSFLSNKNLGIISVGSHLHKHRDGIGMSK